MGKGCGSKQEIIMASQKDTNAQSSDLKVALVTGATTGLGYDIAKRLARDGFFIVATATTEANCKKIIESFHEEGLTQIRALALNVTQEESVINVMAKIDQEFGRLDVLINNAGVALRVNGKKSLVVDTPLKDWQQTIDINLTGTFLVSKHAIRLMQRHKWGRIINMSSRAGRTRTILAGAHYAASKAGILGFTRILADELAPHGITVNAVAPTRISTPMAKTVSNPAEMDARFIAETPVGRLGLPRDVSAVVGFLVSDEADFLTGITIDICGGQFMP
jgi:3-oxoacyl-[acyl-carrier protein] reductase